MPKVDPNRLKGNYGAAYVSTRLSSECLVRPVAVDTDVSVDLYCETVEDNRPFLHFWVQVKAGSQCQVVRDRESASCSFKVEHLVYWRRQPVPVFAALVPVDWPVTDEPAVYIVDITSQLLDKEPSGSDSVTLKSDYVWHAGNCEDVRQFLGRAVPAAAARLQCRNGVVASMPRLEPSYVISFPTVPVSRFKNEISHQIRRTAAFSIWFLYKQGEMGPESAEFRQTLASVVEQFGDDPHWENFMARALSYHADGQYENALSMYEKAEKCISDDLKVRDQVLWQEKVQEIHRLKQCARDRTPLSKSWGTH